jgi:hypothetical protein
VFHCVTHPVTSTRSFLLARLLYSVGHAQSPSYLGLLLGGLPHARKGFEGKKKKEKGDAYFFKWSGLPHSFDSRALTHSITSFGIPRKRRKNKRTKSQRTFLIFLGIKACAVSEEGKVCAAGEERKQLYLFLKCDNRRASVMEFTSIQRINGA